MDSIWEDPGYQYLWSEEAHQFLLRLGVENTADLIRDVSDRYKQKLERDRKKGEDVRNARGLAKTMLHHAGYDALRRRSVLIQRRRHPLVQVPIPEKCPDIVTERSATDDEWPVSLPLEDEVLQQIHSLPPERTRDELWGNHTSMLMQMGEDLGKWLLRPSDPVICELHEDGCPHPHSVLAISQAVVHSLLNELIEQESWSDQDKTALKPHHRRTPEEWEERLYKRLQGLASAQARAVNSVLFNDTAAGRQAKSRVARCVLYCIWVEAQAAKFRRLAELAAIAVGWAYARQLARAGTAQSTQRRLHAWLAEYQPARHDALGCTPASCPGTGFGTGHVSTANEGDLA